MATAAGCRCVRMHMQMVEGRHHRGHRERHSPSAWKNHLSFFHLTGVWSLPYETFNGVNVRLRCKLAPIYLHLIIFLEALPAPQLQCTISVYHVLLMVCFKGIMLLCLLMERVGSMLQTVSGKTYTMGTSLKDGCQTGLIPKVMNILFSKIETLKHDIEFQLHVSFNVKRNPKFPPVNAFKLFALCSCWV